MLFPVIPQASVNTPSTAYTSEEANQNASCSDEQKPKKRKRPRLSIALEDQPIAKRKQQTVIARNNQSHNIIHHVVKETNPRTIIGQGVFGHVAAVELPEPHTDIPHTSYAVKYSNNNECVESIKREVQIACAIKHPNIVNYLGATIKQTDDGTQTISVVMELMTSTLDKLLVEAHTYTLKKRLQLIKDIALGLAYLHQRGLVHNDIKLDNILIDSEGKALIGDLGRTLPHTGYCDFLSSKIAPEMRCFCPLQIQIASKWSSLDPLQFNPANVDFAPDLETTAQSDTEESGTTYHLPKLASVENEDGKTDIYALGYIAMQFFLHKTHVSVWEYGTDGLKSTIAPELAEYRTLYANNPAALQILERLIIPCLGLERDQRPSATEVINILDGLLAQM